MSTFFNRSWVYKSVEACAIIWILTIKILNKEANVIMKCVEKCLRKEWTN